MREEKAERNAATFGQLVALQEMMSHMGLDGEDEDQDEDENDEVCVNGQ